MNNRAKPADLELTDDEIEALALKHIAPGYERLRAVVPEFAPYQQSEQFRRVKALIGDVLSKLQAPVIDLRPHLEWALGRIRASLDTGDKYEAAQAALDAAKAAPQASANDFAKLQRAYVGACDQIAELLARKQASAENAPVAGEAIGYVDSLYLACRLRGLPCNGTIHRTPTSDATAPIYAAPQASADAGNTASPDLALLVGFIFDRFGQPGDAGTLPDNVAAAVRRLERGIQPRADKGGRDA